MSLKKNKDWFRELYLEVYRLLSCIVYDKVVLCVSSWHDEWLHQIDKSDTNQHGWTMGKRKWKNINIQKYGYRRCLHAEFKQYSIEKLKLYTTRKSRLVITHITCILYIIHTASSFWF
jgi:hypothetical protein